ncbi:MAG: response regulator [Limnochordia bacterium]|jgi:two-component system response regulator DegU|nr:response regulator transcription factor [Bacillota bacterium]NLL07433.1 response regulator transcription factor [Bacillota bacterium]HBG08438.1 DNA-binding response regulator [Bacillota bacterium]
MIPDNIEVLIVDDHPLLRQGLKTLLELEGGITVVGQASNGPEALRLAEQLQPQVVLLDINMPGMNGIEVAKVLREQQPETAILVLTIHDDETYVKEMIRSGAKGYLLKDAEPREVVAAIRKVAAGESVYPAELMERVMAHYHSLEVKFGRLQTAAAISDLSLTARELEILQYIVEGMSNKEIAAALYISEKTVKNHITSLLRKLDVEDRTQAAVFAVSQGLFPQE